MGGGNQKFTTPEELRDSENSNLPAGSGGGGNGDSSAAESAEPEGPPPDYRFVVGGVRSGDLGSLIAGAERGGTHNLSDDYSVAGDESPRELLGAMRNRGGRIFASDTEFGNGGQPTRDELAASAAGREDELPATTTAVRSSSQASSRNSSDKTR